MITLTSDLKLAFEQLQIKFMSILDGHRAEIEELTKKAVDSFDFEDVLRSHVHDLMREGLDKVFSEIDLSDRFRTIIWTEIEKKMEIPPEEG